MDKLNMNKLMIKNHRINQGLYQVVGPIECCLEI
jgi:hypothetical protein